MEKKWNKEAIIELIDKNDKAVERALIVIYDRQTEEEKEIEQTKDHNGIGFNSIDAEFLTSCAEGLKKYGKLTIKQIAVVRKRIRKYWKQLLFIANGEEN
jgi:hypothetical protein